MLVIYKYIDWGERPLVHFTGPGLLLVCEYALRHSEVNRKVGIWIFFLEKNKPMNFTNRNRNMYKPSCSTFVSTKFP